MLWPWAQSPAKKGMCGPNLKRITTIKKKIINWVQKYTFLGTDKVGGPSFCDTIYGEKSDTTCAKKCHQYSSAKT